MKESFARTESAIPTIDVDNGSGTSERALMLKIDLWLLPCVVIIFLLSFLDKSVFPRVEVVIANKDRTNLANANIFGLSDDLHLHGNQFNTALVMLFVAYAIFDVPFTIALRQIRPSIWRENTTSIAPSL